MIDWLINRWFCSPIALWFDQFIDIDEQVKEYVYSYATSEDLFNADFESVIKSIGKDFNEINESECTVSISVTVSVGYDANFISVTVV